MEVWEPGKNAKYYSYKSVLKYGGALFAKLFGEVPEEVKSFLDTDLPKIYVALTSGEGQVLDKVYEAVKDMNVKVIICSTLHAFKENPTPTYL